jgi:hypothetical protein
MGRAKNSFAKLFQPSPRNLKQIRPPQPSEQAPPATMPPGAHAPQLDCKIRAIPADPSIDRGIRMSKRSDHAQFAMRIVEHPCLKQ